MQLCGELSLTLPGLQPPGSTTKKLQPQSTSRVQLSGLCCQLGEKHAALTGGDHQRRGISLEKPQPHHQKALEEVK